MIDVDVGLLDDHFVLVEEVEVRDCWSGMVVVDVDVEVEVDADVDVVLALCLWKVCKTAYVVGRKEPCRMVWVICKSASGAYRKAEQGVH